MFLLLTYYGMCLFFGFCVGDSDNNTASIRQRSISCVSLESFLFIINLNIVSYCYESMNFHFPLSKKR